VSRSVLKLKVMLVVAVHDSELAFSVSIKSLPSVLISAQVASSAAKAKPGRPTTKISIINRRLSIPSSEDVWSESTSQAHAD
jgi:hypothetical protein